MFMFMTTFFIIFDIEHLLQQHICQLNSLASMCLGTFWLLSPSLTASSRTNSFIYFHNGLPRNIERITSTVIFLFEVTAKRLGRALAKSTTVTGCLYHRMFRILSRGVIIEFHDKFNSSYVTASVLLTLRRGSIIAFQYPSTLIGWSQILKQGQMKCVWDFVIPFASDKSISLELMR